MNPKVVELKRVAQGRANNKGITHYVCGKRGGKYKIFRHGEHMPFGWRIIETVAPHPKCDKGADKIISQALERGDG